MQRFAKHYDICTVLLHNERDLRGLCAHTLPLFLRVFLRAKEIVPRKQQLSQGGPGREGKQGVGEGQ